MEAKSVLPSPAVYEQEYAYWPWGELLEVAASWVRDRAPKGAFVVDYMCGTGFLLNKAVASRSDIRVAGCSLTPEFVEHARQAYPNIDISLEDALVYKPARTPDIVLCTAGLHHLERPEQPQFLSKVASELRPGGCLLLGEEIIRDYASEKDRRLAVVEMVAALIAHAIEKDAPPDVLAAAADVMVNDLLERGEYKRSRSQLYALLDPDFTVESELQTWPGEGMPYGDVFLVCQRR